MPAMLCGMLAGGGVTDVPMYFRFGIGPFRFSQRLGRTPPQHRRAAKAAAARRQDRRSRAAAAERELESRLAAQERAKHLMGEVSGYYADANVVKFCIEDWINPRTLELTVPRDQAPPETWDAVVKAHDGAVVKAEFPSGPGSSGVADFKFIWNADGTPDPDWDGSPEMNPVSPDHPAYFGFKRFADRVRSERLAQEDLERLRRELEEAKQTGNLLLGDGQVSAWHGVTSSGRQCHHRHRSPEAASECAARLQQQEG
jgi:hypothetical protein